MLREGVERRFRARTPRLLPQAQEGVTDSLRREQTSFGARSVVVDRTKQCMTVLWGISRLGRVVAGCANAEKVEPQLGMLREDFNHCFRACTARQTLQAVKPVADTLRIEQPILGALGPSFYSLHQAVAIPRGLERLVGVVVDRVIAQPVEPQLRVVRERLHCRFRPGASRLPAQSVKSVADILSREQTLLGSPGVLLNCLEQCLAV